MSTAKKQPIEPVEEGPDEVAEELSDELAFDVKNDWRKEADSTQTNLFKEDDMEVSDEEMDTSIFSLDTSGEVKKESLKEHAKAQKEAMKHARRKRTGEKSDTLKALQEAAQGGEAGDVDELEILTEEDKALVNDPIFTNKGDLYPQIHGNYFLLDHLVDGGMAKVCRARYLGEGDEADKMVAIKMVQEKFSADESFVQMFVDEIKVSFGLNHPNINTTFDYGKIGKNLFVSMEYIHGKDLMVVIDKLKAQKKTIPVPMAIMIASKMAEALHYAHNFTNQLTGQKYNIVHRDISPHNAMVSYDGFVKVIDFGIAKADTNTTEEEEGTIKGKINYFAPEYLEGKKIDHRYDQFAVGLTLWEMLTGRKTFTGKDQLLTLKTILECNPDLASKYNKKVPKALDKIIMKSLSKDPANRYKDMEAFNKALMKMLYQTYPDFHESDISKMMKALFKKDYERDLEKFKGFGQYSIKEIVAKIDAYKEFQKNQKEKAKKSGNEVMEFDFGFDENTVSIRGKSNLESLIAQRKKKKKPGQASEKSQRSRQKAIASMLDDEDSVETVGSFERNKGKIIFLGLIALAFFQKEVIYNTLFSGGSLLEPAQNNVVQKQIQEQKKRVAKRTKKQKENQAFLKKLQEQKAKEAAQAQAKAQPTRAQQAQRAKPKTQRSPASAAPIKNVNISSKQMMDQLLKKKKAAKVAPKVAPRPSRVGTTEIKNVNISSKQMVDKLLNKKPKSNVRPKAPRPVAKKPAPIADIDNLSFEEMKKRMEAQLAERKKKIQREKAAVSEATNTEGAQMNQVIEDKGQARVPASEQTIPGAKGVDTAALGGSAETEGLESSTEVTEETEASPETSLETSQEARENLNNMMNQNQAAAIEDQLNQAEEEYKNESISLSESVSELKDKLKAQNERALNTGANVQQETSQTAQEATSEAQKKPVPSAQSELEELKAKMAKLIEEEKKRQEEPSIDKVDIRLEEEKVEENQEAAVVEEDPEDIQRDLASRLKELDEGGGASEGSPETKDSGVVDGVVDFLKSRRAFGWMFDD